MLKQLCFNKHTNIRHAQEFFFVIWIIIFFNFLELFIKKNYRVKFKYYCMDAFKVWKWVNIKIKKIMKKIISLQRKLF